MKTVLRACAVMAILLVAATAARADTALETIIKRGTLIVGVSLGTPPFGITNASMEPDGYDVSMAKLLAAQMGVKVQIVDTVAANRVPSLTSGKVDMVISSFSITPERAKAIAFSDCIYVDQQVAMAPKATTLTGIADLKGKRVGVTRATTNDIATTRRAPEGTNIQRYDDDASTSQALLSGQVDAAVTSASLANAIRDRNPSRPMEVKFVVSQAPMAIGLRLGEPDLLRWVNTTLFILWTNGDIQPLQQKWFGTVNAELPRF